MSALSPHSPSTPRVQPVVSIIIPAHDEEVCMVSCLTSLLRQDAECAMEVIVVANGCSDRTAELARSLAAAADDAGVRLEVVETEESSKTNALNIGDAHSSDSDVRIYLDADSELSANCVRSLSDALSSDAGVLECCPRAKIVSTGSWVSTRYFSVWRRTPQIASDVWGKGCIAVGREGRSRWSTFPDVVADDGFVHLHFDQGERRVVDAAWVRVQVPAGLRELIKVRIRWIRGEVELFAAHPELRENDGAAPTKSGPTLLKMARNPINWIPLAIFIAVNLHTKWRGRRTIHSDKPWERATRTEARDEGGSAGRSGSAGTEP